MSIFIILKCIFLIVCIFLCLDALVKNIFNLRLFLKIIDLDHFYSLSLIKAGLLTRWKVTNDPSVMIYLYGHVF